MVKVKNGKVDINRVLYKDIKRYDRETMQGFLQDIYESGIKKGYEKGLQEASKGLSEENIKALIPEITQEIAGIKGIGIVKLMEIEKILKKHIKELVQNGPEQNN